MRAFADGGRDDLALGHVIVLLQHDWPQGEALFLKAVDKICDHGSFQYENFFNYVTSILYPLGRVNPKVYGELHWALLQDYTGQ